MTSSNEIRIENCTMCNYTCKFCSHHTKSFVRNKEIMNNDLYKLIIDKTKKELLQITDVTVSGFGEALLDKDLIEKIKYAKSQEYKVHFLTNGSLLTEKIIDSLIELVEDIRISLHTTIKEHYVEITKSKEKDFDNVLKMIDYISNHSLKKDTKLVVTGVIIEDNKNDVEQLVGEIENKVDLLEIWKPHNWVTWGSYREGPIVKNTCGRPFNGPIQVQVDGTVNMCCFDYNGRLLLGDLKKQSFEEIFNSNEILNIKSEHLDGKIKQSNLICSKCDQIRDSGSIVVYNNKYSEVERIGKTSTNYRSVK